MTVSIISSPPLFVEGTWTPTIIGHITPGTQTYTAQAGYYTRIGSRVLIDFRVAISALDPAIAGNAVIGGLPFAALTDANMGWSIAITSITGVTHNANAIQFAGGVLSGNSFISLNDFAHATTAGAASAIPVTALASTTIIRGAGSYRIP